MKHLTKNYKHFAIYSLCWQQYVSLALYAFTLRVAPWLTPLLAVKRSERRLNIPLPSVWYKFDIWRSSTQENGSELDLTAAHVSFFDERNKL